MEEAFWWRGKPASEMSREELVEAIIILQEMYKDAIGEYSRTVNFLLADDGQSLDVTEVQP